VALILRRVGRYELLKEIGRGGMATVYLARQTDLDRHVALKELATLHSADEAFAERFLRDSRRSPWRLSPWRWSPWRRSP
jgi:serine/threonine protein kinase